MAMLDTSPSLHLAGTFGHEVSTSNLGRLRACVSEVCAAASVPKCQVPSTPATMTDATRTARHKLLCFIAHLQKIIAIGIRVRDNTMQIVHAVQGISYFFPSELIKL